MDIVSNGIRNVVSLVIVSCRWFARSNKISKLSTQLDQSSQQVDNCQFAMSNKWFKNVLLLNGVNLFDSDSKYDKLIGRVFIVFNYISNIYRIALNVSLIVFGISVFRDLLFIAIAVCGMVAHVQLARNRKIIASVLNDFSSKIPATAKESLIRTQRKYIGLVLFATISEVTRRCLLWADEGTARYLRRANMKLTTANFGLHVFCAFEVFSYSHFTYGWLLHTMVIYAYMFKVMLAADVAFYDRSSSAVTKIASENSHEIMKVVKIVRKERHDMATLKKVMSDSLSLFPLLWFSSLFIETTMRLVHFTKEFHHATMYYIAIKWSSYLICLLFAVWVTVLVEDIVASEATRAYTLTNALNRINAVCWETQVETLGLTMEVGNFQSQRPSAWGLFDLKKSVILNFMGTAIPFSVMINEFVAVAKS